MQRWQYSVYLSNISRIPVNLGLYKLYTRVHRELNSADVTFKIRKYEFIFWFSGIFWYFLLYRSGPNFVWDLTRPLQGKFMNAQNYKKWKFENAEKYYEIRELFLVFVSYCTKRRCSQIEPQWKVEIKA